MNPKKIEKLTEQINNPVDILAFCYEHLGLCGCIDKKSCLETIEVLLLRDSVRGTNKKPFDDFVDDYFGGNYGTAYLVMCALSEAGLIEHGTSTRYSWLTPLGEKFLNILFIEGIENICKSSGEAYNGAWYDGSLI